MVQEEFKELIRIADADLHGNKPIYHALRRIKGVGYSFSNAICNLINMDKYKKIGTISDSDLKKIEEMIRNPSKYGIKSWLFNRVKDYDTGSDVHLISSDVKFRKEFDIKRLQKIKSNRGIRHALGLPVRGQKTRSNFRSGKTVGVKKKSAKKGRV